MANRVALHSHATMSVREAADRKRLMESSDELVPHKSSHGTGESTGGVPSFQRVRDREAIEEAMKPANQRTPQEQISDYYFNLNQRQQAEARQKKIDDARAAAEKAARDAAERERALKRTTFQWREQIRDGIYDQHGLTKQEIAQCNQTLVNMDKLNDMNSIYAVAMRAAAERK